jgi:hypothetical protein
MPAGAPPSAAGEDHRYHYARWNGKRWVDHEIAYAGSCLYSSELDYTANITLDPGDPDTVYISTNVEPKSARPLLSRADGQRHHEVFKGTTTDRGASWSWTSITTDSSAGNLRPIVPADSGESVVLLWLRGSLPCLHRLRPCYRRKHCEAAASSPGSLVLGALWPVIGSFEHRQEREQRA